MPLIKGDIIDRALLELGENTVIYNSNLDDIKTVAGSLFDNIIRALCLDENFMFNLATLKKGLDSFLVEGIWYDSLTWNDAQYWVESAIPKSAINEFAFELPSDFMGMLNAKEVPNKEYSSYQQNTEKCCYSHKDNLNYRIQGNTLYTNKPEIALTYFKRYELADLPLYFEEYLVYSLAFKLSKAYTTYEDKAQLMIQQRNSAKKMITMREGLPFAINY